MSGNLNKKEKFLTKEYLIICFITVFIRLGMHEKMAAMPLYVVDLNYSKTATGLMMTVYTISALLLRPIAGQFIDKYGRKNMLLFGTVLFTLTTFPVGMTQSLLLLYVLQALSGIGFSFLSVAWTTIVTDIVPESRLADGLGYYGLTATLAQALAPTIALWTIVSYGYRLNFILVGIVCVIAIFMIFLVNYEKNHSYIETRRKAIKEKQEEDRWGFVNKLVERNALYPSLIMGLIAFVYASTATFLLPLAKQDSIENIGLYFTVRAISIAVSRVLAGKLTKKYNNRIIVTFSIISLLFGVLGVFVFKNITALLIVGFIYGFGFGMSSVVLNVGAVLNTPRVRRAAANATFYLAMDAGFGLGSVVWGVVGDVVGLRFMFLVASIFCIGVFMISQIIMRKRHI